jgi:hypothetical protein
VALPDAESFLGLSVLAVPEPASFFAGLGAEGVVSLLSLLAGAIELELEDRESFL